MSEFQRFAVYHIPDEPTLAAFGSSWLGWDIVQGRKTPLMDVTGLEEITATPRKYGLHATLKPPFKLSEGQTPASLAHAVARLAAQFAPVILDRLEARAIGQFLALVPAGRTTSLADLARACVTTLDPFRRPPDAAELARRRAAGLSPAQEALLQRWGYPYVFEEFRFHITLSGKLLPQMEALVQDQLRRSLPPIPQPYSLRTISLVGERADGHFEQIHRYALTG